jgi:putative transposase
MTSFVYRIQFTKGRNSDECRADYRELFRKQISEIELDAMREATNKAWALGNDRFKEKTEALAGRRTTPRPTGRPKKGLD